MANIDDRNYEVTCKVAEILNNIKGFDVALGAPRNGNIIIKYNNTNYLLNISPLYTEDGDEKRQNVAFEDICRENKYLLN